MEARIRGWPEIDSEEPKLLAHVGFKAGSPSVNHGHMDIGSFVMEAEGVRWAFDLGVQNYNSLESKGIKVFGKDQDAQRWSILRMNNYFHNTLTSIYACT